jgi:hypothetical protein
MLNQEFLSKWSEKFYQCSVSIFADDLCWGRLCSGSVVTAHKTRTEIVGGKIQITRCGNDACEALNLWL